MTNGIRNARAVAVCGALLLFAVAQIAQACCPEFTWYAHPDIQVSITQPDDGDEVYVGSEVSCLSAASDEDTIDPVPEPLPDLTDNITSWKWTASRGSWKNGDDDLPGVTWIAPDTPSASVNADWIRVTVNDQPKLPEPPYGGTRDDEPPKQTTINVTVLLVDLDISGVDEGDEDSVGGFVVLNAPRKQIILRKVQPAAWSGNVILTRNNTKVKVYDALSGGTEITFNDTDNKFANSALPKDLWVQGETVSGYMRDVTLTLAVEDLSSCNDTVKVTVIDVDLDISGVDEADEEDPGGFVALNDDDDDNDEVVDKDDASVPGEDDLIAISISYAPANLDEGTLKLDVTSGGSKINGKVWTQLSKGVDNDLDLSDDTTWDLSTDPPDNPLTLYVEGYEVSGSVRDIEIKLEYTEGGTTCEDQVKVTVFSIASITPASPAAHKIMISTKHDDTYPSAAQTEDRKVKVEATITPVEEDVGVYFRTYDPDDKSSYETDSNGTDNDHTTYMRGALSAAPGYSVVGGSSETDGNGNVIALGIETDAQGKAAVILQITDRYAGDNYEVRAHPCKASETATTVTGLLVAWKRIYVEEDKMYESGTDLAQNAAAAQDQITVDDASGFAPTNSVIVFDADHPDGEQHTISAINGNTITLSANLDNSYDAGYPSGTGKGAALVLSGTDVYDADVTSRTDDAYGSSADGSDGGCFVEIKILSDGGNNVPYRLAFGGDQALADYQDVWFNNKNKSNYVYVCAAAHGYFAGDGNYGLSEFTTYNCCYILIEEIDRDYNEPELSVVNADVTAHEIGHQFALTQVDGNHPNVWCHLGQDTDYCVMDSARRDRDDEHTEFCYDAPNHLHDIRWIEDNL